MEIQFIGAAQTVTGSMHKITVGSKTILLDCGLFQGKRSLSYERNKNFPFDPVKIDAVILSHAHIDHAGNLPNLVRQGFNANIFATPATVDLCEIMLKDSAHINLRDIQFVNKKLLKKHLPKIDPLYEIEDVENTIKLFYPKNYNHEFEVVDGITAMFFDAGHILGSASVLLTIQEPGKSKKIKLGFSGDLGRPKLPILRDPEFIGNVDYFICESTYGNKIHTKVDDMEKELLFVINKTINRNGKIIIPAFSVGRTQEVIYALNNLFNKNLLPKFDVFIDSPLAVNATNIHRNHEECFDKETLNILKKDDDIFNFPSLHFIQNVEDSKKLNDRTEPCIIISASGMCEGGRILHHLANNIGNKNNTVLIVGYQAEHTLGRKLVERFLEIPIFGEIYKRDCEIVVLNSFSAHADKNELEEYCSKFDTKKVKQIFLVHGELLQSVPFSEKLKLMGFSSVQTPKRLDTFNTN
ncbi:MAG: MBL fold metallo-hydrolase [Bacteroidetes bacterium]|nr:MBL fold metallo-hydrolase [Bacteroidota bacterium]